MEIVLSPDPVLKQECEDVSPSELREMKKLAKQMAKTMYDSSGCGLAAPQVGITKKIIVIDCNQDGKKKPTCLINPEIIETAGEPVTECEGCLSIPGISLPITRPEDITVRYMNLKGEEITHHATGFEARCIQHECDHLHGVTMFEHLSLMDRIKAFQEYEAALAAGAKPGDVSVEDADE
ncbi:MAG: peptide deformylase [bacterium]|nr:peptide deformylase [bacterium]